MDLNIKLKKPEEILEQRKIRNEKKISETVQKITVQLEKDFVGGLIEIWVGGSEESY